MFLPRLHSTVTAVDVMPATIGIACQRDLDAAERAAQEPTVALDVLDGDRDAAAGAHLRELLEVVLLVDVERRHRRRDAEDAVRVVQHLRSSPVSTKQKHETADSRSECAPRSR